MVELFVAFGAQDEAGFATKDTKEHKGTILTTEEHRETRREFVKEMLPKRNFKSSM